MTYLRIEQDSGGYLKAFRTFNQIGKDNELSEKNEHYSLSNPYKQNTKMKEKKWVEDNIKRRKMLKDREKRRLKREEMRIKSELEKYRKMKNRVNPMIDGLSHKPKNRRFIRVRRLPPLGKARKEPSREDFVRRVSRSPIPNKFTREETVSDLSDNNVPANSIISEPLPSLSQRKYRAGPRSTNTFAFLDKNKKNNKRRKRRVRLKRRNARKQIINEEKPKWKRELETGFSQQIEDLENSIEKIDKILINKKKNLKIFKFNEKLIKKKINILKEN